jgi:hypothetical protein
LSVNASDALLKLGVSEKPSQLENSAGGLSVGGLVGEDWIEGGDSASDSALDSVSDSALDSDSASDSSLDSVSASLSITVSINDIYIIKGDTYLQLLADLVPFELFHALQADLDRPFEYGQVGNIPSSYMHAFRPYNSSEYALPLDVHALLFELVAGR